MKPLRAVAILSLLVGLILLGLFDRSAPTQAPPPPATGVYNDLALYRDIVTDMHGGAGYYDAAISEARKHNYPLRPFVTVRLPTLAWVTSTLPSDIFAWGGLMALAFATLCAWARRLRAARLTKLQYTVAIICITSGLYPAMFSMFALFHETWAGLLIALSLAIRRKDAWIASVLVGLAAALTRELAVAYLLAMAAMALKERNIREAIAWAAAITLFALALVVHAANVNALVTTNDLASPGWFDFGGWHFVLQAARWNVFLSSAPQWIAAIVTPLALFGLTSTQFDQRLLLVVFGYVFAFLMVGRTENIYWWLLIAPLWPLGLSGAVSAMTACLSETRYGWRPASTTLQ